MKHELEQTDQIKSWFEFIKLSCLTKYWIGSTWTTSTNINSIKKSWIDEKKIKQCPQAKSHSSSPAAINSSSWISSSSASSLKNWVISLSLSVSVRASKGQFFWIMTRALRFSVPSLQRRRDVRMPAMEKIRSHSIWLPGMPRNCRATKATVGKRDSCSFHHNNGQATLTGSTTRRRKRLSSPSSSPCLLQL